MRDVTARSSSSGESAPTGKSCSSANSEMRAGNISRMRSNSSNSGSSLSSCSCFGSFIVLPATLESSLFSVSDRWLERKPGVPGEIDPGVLRHLGNERVDHRPAHGLGVDGREMRLGQQFAHHLRGLSGIDEIVDNQHALAAPATYADDVGGDTLEHLELALDGVVVAPHANRLDQANVELARDDRRRDETAARDADDRLERTGAGQPPDQRARVAMELVPGNGERPPRVRLAPAC